MYIVSVLRCHGQICIRQAPSTILFCGLRRRILLSITVIPASSEGHHMFTPLFFTPPPLPPPVPPSCSLYTMCPPFTYILPQDPSTPP